MYSYLEKLQERVLYTDTDSELERLLLRQGDYLGDLTDALGGDGTQEFAFTDPKIYACQTQRENTVLQDMQCAGQL